MNTPHQLTLYHFESCRFCARVRDYITQHKLPVPMKDIELHPEFQDELVSIGGKPQVPCLVIDGKALYESYDIIEWLKGNFES